MAVLFTDIAGFTKLSEKMDPQDVLDLLSEYQTLMVDKIFQHKGTVDKFIGDAVNVASRICDACKNFDTNFLISADVASRIAHNVPSEDAPNVGIRGREGNIDLVKIYSERLST